MVDLVILKTSKSASRFLYKKNGIKTGGGCLYYSTVVCIEKLFKESSPLLIYPKIINSQAQNYISVTNLNKNIQAKDDQLRSANNYLETMSCERETDRLEIIELTQTLSQERRKRDVEKQLIDELKQQVSINVISVQWNFKDGGGS